jgi:hypothetical protein
MSRAETPHGTSELAHRGLRRDQRVVEQCIEGVSLLTIGQQQGFVSPGPTVRLIDRALDNALPQLDARAQRRIDNARLDRLLASWWKAATTGDVASAHLVLAILELRSRVRDAEPGVGPL